MRYNARHSHDETHDHDEVRDDLVAATKSYLDDGLRSDILRAMTIDQSGDASSIQVRVGKEQSHALADSLRTLVNDPKDVYVTDESGRRVPLNGAVTHEDLAEMVCARGFKLHIVPHEDYAGFAAQVASATAGRVIIPGQKPVCAHDVDNYVVQSLESGDMSLLNEMKNLLGKGDSKALSPASIGLIRTLSPEDRASGQAHPQHADKFAAIVSGWQEWRNNQGQSEESAPSLVNSQRHEVVISAMADAQRKVVTISSFHDEQNVTFNDAMEGLPDEQFQSLLWAKAEHFKAASALSTADSMNPSSQEMVAYEQSLSALEAVDPGGTLDAQLSTDQRMAIFRMAADAAKEHHEDIQEPTAPIDSMDREMTVDAGTDIIEIIRQAQRPDADEPQDGGE